MRSRFVGLVALGTIARACLAAVPDAPAELQGRWVLVSVEVQGREEAPLAGRPVIEVVGDRIRYGGEAFAEVVAEPGASPKSIDLRVLDSGRSLEGIYARDGDGLKICLNRQTDGVKERPGLMTTRGRETWRLLTFRRADPREEGTDPGFVGLALGVEGEAKSVVVQGLLDDSPAVKAGLKKGDVLLSIGGAEVTGLRQAVSVVRRARPGGTLPLSVRRGGMTKDIEVRVGRLPFLFIADLG